jgi:hypothetical protein
MSFKPIDKMWERVEVARQDSDVSLFLNLLYLGEMLTKLITVGLVAAVADDRQRHRYRQAHSLVRADGLGEWGVAIDDILTGTAAQYIVVPARDEQRELTQRCGPGTWQYDATALLHKCLRIIDPTYEELPAKVDGRRWFSIFVMLRNKTRGHGAPQMDVCSRICPDLEKSIRILIDNHSLFRRQWAYLRRNLSGKYNVSKLTDDSSLFDSLKSDRTKNFPDGVYVYFDQPTRVELVESTIDAMNFSFPNGGFNDKRFELLSYITGDKSEGDATLYMMPATELPGSETQGIGILDIQGNCFGNLPPVQNGYIHRQGLETELCTILMDDRHPVITLVGRGGIGKTWLTLSVLHKVADRERFDAILWFSARDIDLMPEGPKLVTPHVLTDSDIANEFIRLMEPSIARDKGFKPLTYLAETLTKSSVGPLLFVFDNFETVRNPVELFMWLDTYIRLPNKVLITTRFREFKGDYPVEVLGMTEQESDELMSSTAATLGIGSLLADVYRKELYQESDGHPYVIKVLLGEVAKAGKLVKVEKIVAAQDEILNALFERTYSRLSPVAKRVFLTLCSWRSTIPQLAIEAVLLRPSNEKMDVSEAIDELSRSSFVEVTRSKEDNELFLTVPLVASVFGKRKLAVSPMKSAIEADMQLLFAFGAAQQSDIRHGIAPRINRLFSYIAERVSQGKEQLADHLPMLEFIARKYSPAWLLLASLHEESGLEASLESAKDVVRRYLETKPQELDQQQAWTRQAELCQRTNDWTGEAHALVELCQLLNVPFSTISYAANRLNSLFFHHLLVLDTDEKQVVVRRLVTVMEGRISEADSTDCSRLAWLCLHLRDRERAVKFTRVGLALQPYNEYCQKLATELSIG